MRNRSAAAPGPVTVRLIVKRDESMVASVFGQFVLLAECMQL